MSMADVIKAATGRTFTGTWVGGVLFVVAMLGYVGKIPMPAFASDIKVVSAQMTKLSKEQIAYQARYEGVLRVLGELQQKQAVQKARERHVDDGLKSIGNNVNKMSAKIDKLMFHLMQKQQ